MCMVESAMAKMYNDRKDRKKKEALNANYASAPSAPVSSTDVNKPEPISKPKPKTKIKTGINIGGQY